MENSDVLADYGIEVKGVDGSLKSTYDVLEELKPVWDSLADAQRQELGVTLAGKNQYRVLASILQNFQHATEATETAINSAGSAMQENSAYMESLESKTTLLKASFQTLANDVIPKELIAKGLDVLNSALELLDTDLGKVLVQITLLTGIGWGATSLLGASKLLPAIIGQFSNFFSIISGGTTIVGGLTGAMTLLHSAALPIVAILATLGVIIYNTYQKTQEFSKAVENLTPSLRNFDTAQAQINEELNNGITKTEAVAVQVNKYLDRLDELDKKTNKTKEDQQEYHTILQQIVDICPSVASGIDLQTDSIRNGTSAIRKQIEAWKELAIQQAYQSTMSSLYQKQAEIQLDQAKLKLEDTKLKQQRQTAELALEAAELEQKSILGSIDTYQGQLEKAKYFEGKEIAKTIDSLYESYNDLDVSASSYKVTLNDLGAQEEVNAKASANLSAAQEELSQQISLTEQAMTDLLGTNAGNLGSGDGYNPFAGKDPFASLRAGWSSTEDEDTGGTSGGGSVSSAIKEATFSLSNYTSEYEKLINLLNTQYTLMGYQGASSEDLINKAKTIQTVLHEEAEVLRNILSRADELNLTTEDIYEIQNNINSLSIDWWNWENKINEELEKQDEIFKELAEDVKAVFEQEKESLTTQKDAINALQTEMSNYYQEQINGIDEQIKALQEANAEIEEQITLEQKLDNLAKAKQNKVLVYKDGRFQYVQDTDEVSKAAKELEDLERQRKLNENIEGLEKEKSVLEALKSEWGNMESAYEEEQRKWLISQELGINTALDGWQRLVKGAEFYASQYNSIMSSLKFIEQNQESVVSNIASTKRSGLHYDPNIDYSALMMTATTPDDLWEWGKLREAKIQGEGMKVEKSTAEFYAEGMRRLGYEGYAFGTSSAKGGISLVGENGAELRVLNQGDGIISNHLTKNLMAWGQFTPAEYKLSSLSGGQNKLMNVTIQALNLPNVTNGNDFVEYIKNTMFGQVLSFVH